MILAHKLPAPNVSAYEVENVYQINKFGYADTTFITKLPLVVRPCVPAFLNCDDSIQMNVTLEVCVLYGVL